MVVLAAECEEAAVLGDSVIARLVTHDHRQAVELPEDFRLPGAEVRLTRVGTGVLIEPVEPVDEAGDDLERRFALIDSLVQGQFMLEGREQPAMPETERSFD